MGFLTPCSYAFATSAIPTAVPTTGKAFATFLTTGLAIDKNLFNLSLPVFLFIKPASVASFKVGKLKPIFKKIAKVAKIAGKVIKPLGIATGLAAVNTAAQAGERNLFDLAGAYITGDPEVATTGRRIRQEPEFRTQYMADLLSRPLDEGTYDAIDESFTSYFDGGIVSVLKGVK